MKFTTCCRDPHDEGNNGTGDMIQVFNLRVGTFKTCQVARGCHADVGDVVDAGDVDLVNAMG